MIQPIHHLVINYFGLGVVSSWMRAVLKVAFFIPCAAAIEAPGRGPLSLLLAQAASRTENSRRHHVDGNEDAFLAKAVDDAAKLAREALQEAGIQANTKEEATDTVAAAALRLADAEEIKPIPEHLAVWVTGFPRSGSSTTLAMVKALSGVSEYYAVGDAFALFEPCHGGDELEPALQEEGCAGLLTKISKCDFSQVNKLWGWDQPHTTSNHSLYTKETARSICKASHVVAFKTVDFGHHLDRFFWLLDSQPALRVVATVRDPRGIYASWKTTPPFPDLLRKCDDCKGGHFYTMKQVCDAFAANLGLKDKRIHTIVFEELLRDPAKVTRRASEFLGKEFGAAQESWINRTFNAKECPEVPSWQQGFADCHTQSSSKPDSWRSVLDEAELALFKGTESCQEVAKAYGYPLE